MRRATFFYRRLGHGGIIRRGMVVYGLTTKWCRTAGARSSDGSNSGNLNLQRVQGLSLDLHQVVHSSENGNQGINVEWSVN